MLCTSPNAETSPHQNLYLQTSLDFLSSDYKPTQKRINKETLNSIIHVLVVLMQFASPFFSDNPLRGDTLGIINSSSNH